MQNVKRFFQLAKNASTFSDFPKQKLGAVIVYKNKVLSVGWNTSKTIPMQRKFNKYRNFDPETAVNSAHAEMIALDRLLKQYDNVDFSRCSIFVWRNYKDGSPALARPCPACEHALREIGITDVYYTGRNSFIHEKYLEKTTEDLNYDL